MNTTWMPGQLWDLLTTLTNKLIDFVQACQEEHFVAYYVRCNSEQGAGVAKSQKSRRKLHTLHAASSDKVWGEPA